MIERGEQLGRVPAHGPDHRLRRADGWLDDEVRVLAALECGHVFCGYGESDLPFRQLLDEAIARFVDFDDVDVLRQLFIQFDEPLPIRRRAGNAHLLSRQVARR